jgi:hypothetical protein
MQYLTLFLLVWGLASSGYAQQDSTLTDSTITDFTLTDSLKVVDTLVFSETNLLANSNPVTSPINFEERLTQKPTVALLKSMVVPGWGQVGNKSYFKAVLFAGLDAWFVGAAIHYGRQASDFRDRFENTVEINSRNELYDLYLDRKDERNKYTWFAVIVTFVSMFDAYADAHLSGYPRYVDDNKIGFRLDPTLDGGVNASVSVNF